jgi:uncharacterized protein YbbC (DUF1343 family)
MGEVGLTRRSFSLGGAALIATPAFAARPAQIQTGLDRLIAGEGANNRGHKVALLTHAGARDAKGRRSVDAVAGIAGLELTALLSPEHGLSGSAAAGEHVADARDAATGLPVYSLYGARRAPPPELLRQIDTVLIDLQDIGLRCFTYAATMSDVMRAAAKQGVRVMVLDRPNPLGGLKIDGPLMDPALASPVGALPTPFRHGLTLGELAGLIQANERLELDLSVLPMRGWTPAMGSTVFGKGQLPFTPPSPNLRSPGAVLAYAASVLLEGCNVSEGRGTARPFETLGAPWCDGPALARALSALRLPGVRFSPLRFTPTSSKHAGQTCSGIRFVVLDETRYDPLLTGLSIVAALRRLHPQDFTFLLGERPFFDLLIGQSWVREALLLAEPAKAIVQRWQGDADRFRRLVPRFRIYS